MPAEFAIANNPRLLQIDDRRIVAVPHRRQVTPGRMAQPVIVPVRRAAKDRPVSKCRHIENRAVSGVIRLLTPRPDTTSGARRVRCRKRALAIRRTFRSWRKALDAAGVSEAK